MDICVLLTDYYFFCEKRVFRRKIQFHSYNFKFAIEWTKYQNFSVLKMHFLLSSPALHFNKFSTKLKKKKDNTSKSASMRLQRYIMKYISVCIAAKYWFPNFTFARLYISYQKYIWKGNIMRRLWVNDNAYFSILFK